MSFVINSSTRESFYLIEVVALTHPPYTIHLHWLQNVYYDRGGGGNCGSGSANCWRYISIHLSIYLPTLLNITLYSWISSFCGPTIYYPTTTISHGGALNDCELPSGRVGGYCWMTDWLIVMIKGWCGDRPLYPPWTTAILFRSMTRARVQSQ